MKEEWKKIEGFPNYSISNLGRVRNDKTEYVLKPYIVGGKNNQYLAVDLRTKKNVKVHRLVAMHFIPNPGNKREVNHIDGKHFNNKISNLEWVTGSENCFHAYRVIGRKKFFGSENHYSKKVIRVEDGKIFGSFVEAAKACGLKSHTSISQAIKGSRKTAGGYHWKIAEAEYEITN